MSLNDGKVQYLPFSLLPHGHASPETGLFSDTERSQVHWPAGRLPEIILSV